MAGEKKAIKDENTVETEDLFIPFDPYSQKKSNLLRLSLNGKELRLERGKTHKVPKAYADLYRFKQAARLSSTRYSQAQLAKNNQPK